ncbi:hypothetical protein BOX15_Mlig019372g2, partial [Macrostomum lignano]
ESSGKSPPPPVASWAAVARPPTSGLASVMSEQLADHEREQQLRQDLRLAAKLQALAPVEVQSGNGEESRLAKDEHEVASSSPAGQGGESDSDFVLALMLQQEFDREFDRQVRLSEAKLNGNQKVRVTLSNHLRRDTTGAPASDSEEDPAATAVEPPLLPPGPARSFNSRGVSGRGADLLTKHDAEICGRRNAERMAGFGHAGFRTGDTDGLQLDNRVYNSLKVHAAQEERRSAARRQRDSQQQLSQQEQLEQQRRQQLDERTRRLLQRLVTIRRLAEVGEVLKVGDQSLLIHARCDSNSRCKGGRPMPPDVVVKVFRRLSRSRLSSAAAAAATSAESQLEAPCSPRGSPRARCLRELRGLRRLRRAGVASPAPLMLRRHLLLTELVGANGVAAPSLADCLEGGLLSEADWMKAWELTVTALRSTLRLARLVHGNLDGRHLLWWRGSVWLTGLSRWTDRGHPRAGELLLRDCRAVCGFFERARPGLPGLLEAADLAELLGAGEAAGDAAAATAEAAAADEESGEEDEDDDDDAEESGDEAGDLLH